MSRSTTRSAPEHPENEREFTRFLDRHDRVLVEFYADWCHPCEEMDPVLDSVAESRGIPIRKIEVERNPAIAATFDVRAVPTLLLFEDGESIARRVGRQDETELERLIEQAG